MLISLASNRRNSQSKFRLQPAECQFALGLDAVGGPATAAIASVLSPGAHLVVYAWLSGVPIHMGQGDLIVKRLNVHGFWMYYEEYLPKIRAALTEATKRDRLWQINSANHHNIQTVPNQRSNRTRPAWRQDSIGFQLCNLGPAKTNEPTSIEYGKSDYLNETNHC